MTAAPTIGVIVPVHNAAAFLEDCLRAVAAQSFSAFACLLVDDGSQDASPALCDAWAARDARFRVLHQKQSGVSRARAAGMAAARALGVQWFAFCDADDCYHPDFLRLLYDAACKTSLPLACCRYLPFEGALPAATGSTDGCRTLAVPEHLTALLQDHAVDYGLWNKLYASSLLREEMVDNGLAYNEDLLANWRAFRAAPGCAVCDFAGYFYRQHPDSASHRGLPLQSLTEQRTVAETIRREADALPDAPLLARSADAFYYEKLVYLASMILRRSDADRYAEPLAALRREIAAGRRSTALGRNPLLPRGIKFAAWATIYTPHLWRCACRTLLKDRQ